VGYARNAMQVLLKLQAFRKKSTHLKPAEIEKYQYMYLAGQSLLPTSCG
jgi:hypothetical protein